VIVYAYALMFMFKIVTTLTNSFFFIFIYSIHSGLATQIKKANKKKLWYLLTATAIPKISNNHHHKMHA
jgi:hypothetical protein